MDDLEPPASKLRTVGTDSLPVLVGMGKVQTSGMPAGVLGPKRKEDSEEIVRVTSARSKPVYLPGPISGDVFPSAGEDGKPGKRVLLGFRPAIQVGPVELQQVSKLKEDHDRTAENSFFGYAEITWTFFGFTVLKKWIRLFLSPSVHLVDRPPGYAPVG